jgi:hypothetical protein
VTKEDTLNISDPQTYMLKCSKLRVSLYVDSALGYLHRVDVDSAADVSEAHVVFFFRVEASRMSGPNRE